MSYFFARVFALIVAAAAFAAATAILVQLRPEGLGGWGLIVALGVGTLLLPFIVYRVILSPVRRSGPPNEGEGAGLSMGAGIDSARRRDGEDPDPFGD